MFSVKKAAMVAVASISILGLGACSAHPGTAVSVNGVNYSEADVSDALSQYAELTGQPMDRATLVAMLPDALKFTQLANENQISATDEQVNEFVASLVDQGRIHAPSGDFSPVLTEILRYSVIKAQLDQMGQDALATLAEDYKEIAATQKVDINPRYGTITEDGSLKAPIFGDVVDASVFTADQTSGGAESGE